MLERLPAGAAFSTLPLGVALRRSLWLLLPAFAFVVAIALLLPPVPLDGPLAVVAVWVADSGSAAVVPFTALGLSTIVVTRPGLGWRARVREAGVIVGLLALSLGAVAFANEDLVKPALAIPRPAIVELSDRGVLGMDPGAFYALGDKPARSDYLDARLALASAPPLAPEVRAHWVRETGYSFPSGHALCAMTFASFFLVLATSHLHGRRRRLPFLLLPAWALAVVISRPILRVHSGLDVTIGALEGLVLGLATAWIASLLLARLERRAPPTPAPLRAP